MEESQSDNTILFSMEPLLKQARSNHLWLASRYHGIAFSPRELHELISSGRFCWGPDNWELINPHEWQANLARLLIHAEQEYKDFTNRLDREGV